MHIDVFDIAEKIDKLIASGMYCVDELRQKLGDAELGTEESQMHFITKNYTELSEVSDVKGGDTGRERRQSTVLNRWRGREWSSSIFTMM